MKRRSFWKTLAGLLGVAAGVKGAKPELLVMGEWQHFGSREPIGESYSCTLIDEHGNTEWDMLEALRQAAAEGWPQAPMDSEVVAEAARRLERHE